MIEPLAHVAKGSVSRFTVVASSVGSVHFPKSQFLRKDFFTPLPRPARTEDAPSQQSESFSILQSREHTKQCRLWSCLPGSHSVWCPSREESRFLEPTPRPRGRATYSRSNEPASEFLRHFFHYHPYPPIDSSWQRRHASAIPRKPIPEEDDATSHSHSRPMPNRARGSSFQREKPSPREWPLKSKYSPVAAKFLEYAQNERLIRQNPQRAHDACAALLSTTSLELDAHSCFPFVQGMLRAIVNHWARIPDGPPEQWITQMEELLEVSKATCTFSTPTYGSWEDNLRAHISALKGDIERADALLRDRGWCSKHKRQTTEMMNTVIVSLCRTRPAKEVIKYLEDGVDELPALHLSLSWQAPAMKALSDLFHNDSSLFRLIPGITSSFHPAVFLARKFLLDRRDTSKPIPQPWAKETIEAFLMKPEMIQAREIQGIHGTDGQDHRSFMEQNEGPTKKKDRVVQVNVLAELLDLYPDVDAFSYSTDLFLASARGDVKNAEDCFARYSQRAALTYREVHSLLMAYANIGNLPGLKNAFERLFPHSLEGLTTTYFRPAFYALSLSPIPQPEAMEYWREKMRGAHLVPNSGIYALMLQYYANHDDRDAIATTFREIRRNGIPVNKFVYHNMMTFFARRGEVEPVEKLFKFAKLDGITPDLPFYANLMNAYVEAGRWPGLTATYRLLKAVKAQGGRMIVIQNILMKASHLLGVPFEVLEEHFSSLRDLGETPDAHSYTTLIHAACDAGNTEAAERLYWEMVDRDAVEHGFLNTPHALHLLISAHLHRGDLSKVLFFCQEMEDWGIKPTAATIGRLFIAFAQLPKEKAGLLEPTLKKMVTTLRASNMEKGINGLAVGAALERIYYPAIRRAKACGRSGAELVDQLYRQLVALGHEPSLTMETIILDSFRQRREVELVQSQWENIFHKACQARSQSTHFGVGARRPRRTRITSRRMPCVFPSTITSIPSHTTAFSKKFKPPSTFTPSTILLLIQGTTTRSFLPTFAQGISKGHFISTTSSSARWLDSVGIGNLSSRMFPLHAMRLAVADERNLSLVKRSMGVLTHPRAKDPKVSPLIQLLYNMPQRGYWRISWPVKKALKRLVLALKEGYPVVPLSGRRLSPSPTFYHKSFATTGPDPAAASVQLESLMQFPLAWKAGQIWRKTRYTAERRLERRKRRCDGWRATAVEESLET
ncbi:hypothetical protein FA13DRAFT_1374779 [Coprinellus micaceus]|uniref:Pentacotripeptide-repeat region of PRORP domain-containing protein n=1 Tax=Coprinellus micaceus TaxID=71717 RepID=A0A4Y7TNH3_COPMI|nr:hypothetical protein FA13DRAFT_1374779 [Coprinellus micaceus]